jgi:hypothetical protein
MRIEKPNPNDFDALLKAGLKNHTINVPPGFTHKLLTRVQRQDYAAALAAIKMKERLLLGTMILLPLAFAAVVLLIPQQVMTQLTISTTEICHSFLPKFESVLQQWLIIVVAAALLLYGLFDSFLAEN